MALNSGRYLPLKEECLWKQGGHLLNVIMTECATDIQHLEAGMENLLECAGHTDI